MLYKYTKGVKALWCFFSLFNKNININFKQYEKNKYNFYSEH